MYVHRQRASLPAVREDKTQPAVRGTGGRDFPTEPRRTPAGRNGSAGRSVQSVRPEPDRPNGPRNLLVMSLNLSPLCVILSAAKKPESFSTQNTSTPLRTREADLLGIRSAVMQSSPQWKALTHP